MHASHSLGTVLKAVVVAGLLAGTALGLFHTLVTEPIIDQAIALEEARTAHHEDEAPVVSRSTQKAGLVVGSVLYGLFVGLIYGSVYYLAQNTLPGRGVVGRAVLLALAAYWVVALLPFLKYPANPPGVGQAETITYRQTLYVAFLMLSIGSGLLAALAARRLPRWAVGTGYALAVLALFLLLPANPDPVEMPEALVTAFRARSLLGLTLFWLTLGLSFGWLCAWLQPARATGRAQLHPA